MNTDEYDYISDSDDEFFNITPSPKKTKSTEQLQIDNFLKKISSPKKTKSKSKTKYQEDGMTRRTKQQIKLMKENWKKGISALYNEKDEQRRKSTIKNKKNKQTKKRNTLRNNYLIKSIKGLPKIQRYFDENEQQELIDVFIKQNSKYLNNYNLDKYNFENQNYELLRNNLNLNLNQPQDYNFKKVQDFLQQSEYYKSVLKRIYNSNKLSDDLKEKLKFFLNKYDKIIGEGSKGKKRKQTKKKRRKRDNAGCPCNNPGNCNCRRIVQRALQQEIVNVKSNIKSMIRYFSQHKQKVLEILNNTRNRVFNNKIKKYIYISNNNLIIDINNAQSYHALLNIKNLFVDLKYKLEQKIIQEQRETIRQRHVDQMLRNFVNKHSLPTAQIAPATVIANIYDKRPRWNKLKRGLKKSVRNLMKNITRRTGRNNRKIQPAFIVGEKKEYKKKEKKKK